MPKRKHNKKTKRVAISLELDWGFKRHLEVYAGCQRYADEAGWACSIQPAADRALAAKSDAVPFDGILARATPPLVDVARKAGVPIVNVWLNSNLHPSSRRCTKNLRLRRMTSR